MSENSPPKSFNLVTESWIPIAGVGLVSLNDIFTNEYKMLSGTPIEKVVILRLLLCIVHASTDLKSMGDWRKLNQNHEEMALNARNYLKEWESRFDLYDETYPFLQFPQLKGQFDPKKPAPDPNALSLFISTGNTSILTQWNAGTKPSSAELARLLLCGSCYGMGGKKYNYKAKIESNTQEHKDGDEKEKKSGLPGALTGTIGYLHSFMLGNSLWETLLLNLLTEDEFQMLQPEMRLGCPFWESMPEDKDGKTAKKYRSSYLGTLFPIDKFSYLEGEKLQMTQGIKYLTPAEGQWDPGITFYGPINGRKALWCNPEQTPWRQIPSLLEYIKSFNSPAFVVKGFDKLRNAPQITSFGLWVGGIAVNNQAGEQYVSGDKDYVDSSFLIPKSWKREEAHNIFINFMEIIKAYSDALQKAVNDYFRSLKDNRDKKGGIATRLFWEKMEPLAQSIISLSGELSENPDQKRFDEEKRKWRQIALSCYDEFCPHETPRQMRAYTQNIPDFRPRKNNNDKKKGGKK